MAGNSLIPVFLWQLIYLNKYTNAHEHMTSKFVAKSTHKMDIKRIFAWTHMCAQGLIYLDQC